ncbi:MAG: TGS domain-containing protein, partial [Defluviitaleaceae bacterium]|nr:TGS domain-containing protein [Defluviitaleaceae bacterium]
SIYKKMRSKGKAFDEIYDLFAVRVIVDDVMKCYEVLSVVHSAYKPVPGTFKDYIGMPKENQYRSLHTVVMPPDSAPVEVQIRTWEMHKIAEYGIAAHWKYKASREGGSVDDRGEEKLAWLRQILDWQRGFTSNKEFMAALKQDLDIFTDQVYCFTPRGEIITMIKGANSIDFAYRIHSAVGNKMVGTRVNGIMVPIDQELNSGDRVEIITSSNSRGPSRDWLKMVKTSQARLKIQQWFKKESKEDDILRGRDLLERDAKEKGIALADLLSPERRDAVLNKFGFNDWDTMCASIGHGGLREGQIINRLREDYLKEIERLKTPEELAEEMLQKSYEDAARREDKRKPKSGSGIVVRGVGDIDVRLSKCCTPVPGDEIIGFITRGRGVSVHRTDCVNILNLSELDRNRLMESEWQLPKNTESRHYVVDIRVMGGDRNGMLLDITRILDDEKISVKTMNARTPDGTAIFDIALVISNREQLERARMKISNVRDIYKVERVTT